jgi:hypothetical protein
MHNLYFERVMDYPVSTRSTGPDQAALKKKGKEKGLGVQGLGEVSSSLVQT